MINKHKSNKIKENSNTVRHLNNGTDHRHSKSCCDQSSPARRTKTTGARFSNRLLGLELNNGKLHPSASNITYECINITCYFCSDVTWRVKIAAQTTDKADISPLGFNTLRLRQNDRHYADEILTLIFLYENRFILIPFSLKFVPMGPFSNNPALVNIMAWCRIGDRPLFELITT